MRKAFDTPEVSTLTRMYDISWRLRSAGMGCDLLQLLR